MHGLFRSKMFDQEALAVFDEVVWNGVFESGGISGKGHAYTHLLEWGAVRSRLMWYI